MPAVGWSSIASRLLPAGGPSPVEPARQTASRLIRLRLRRSTGEDNAPPRSLGRGRRRTHRPRHLGAVILTAVTAARPLQAPPPEDRRGRGSDEIKVTATFVHDERRYGSRPRVWGQEGSATQNGEAETQRAASVVRDAVTGLWRHPGWMGRPMTRVLRRSFGRNGSEWAETAAGVAATVIADMLNDGDIPDRAETLAAFAEAAAAGAVLVMNNCYGHWSVNVSSGGCESGASPPVDTDPVELAARMRAASISEECERAWAAEGETSSRPDGRRDGHFGLLEQMGRWKPVSSELLSEDSAPPGEPVLPRMGRASRREPGGVSGLWLGRDGGMLARAESKGGFLSRLPSCISGRSGRFDTWAWLSMVLLGYARVTERAAAAAQKTISEVVLRSDLEAAGLLPDPAEAAGRIAAAEAVPWSAAARAWNRTGPSR